MDNDIALAYNSPLTPSPPSSSKSTFTTTDKTRSSIFSDSTDQENFSRCYANLLYIYFLFSYYVGLTPFRFRYDSVQRILLDHKWFPQKVVCAVIQVAVLFRYVVEIRQAYQSSAQPKPIDPVYYFQLIEISSSFIYKAIAFYYFWNKQDIFSRIIRSLHCIPLPENQRVGHFQAHSTSLVSGACIFFICMTIIRFLFDESIFSGSTLVHTNSWIQSLIKASRFSFFEAPEYNQADNVSSVDIMTSIVASVSIFFRILAGFYLDLCIFLFVLSLWALVSAFRHTIDKTGDTLLVSEKDSNPTEVIIGAQSDSHYISHEYISTQFKILRRVSTLMAEAIGGFLLPAMSEIAFGYSVDFEEVILSNRITARITITLYYMSTFTTLIIASEICRKITSVGTWLKRNMKKLKIPPNECMLILDNISNNEIGISAGGRFTINYSFVGALITLLLTFFIIRTQSEPSNR